MAALFCSGYDSVVVLRFVSFVVLVAETLNQ